MQGPFLREYIYIYIYERRRRDFTFVSRLLQIWRGKRIRPMARSRKRGCQFFPAPSFFISLLSVFFYILFLCRTNLHGEVIAQPYRCFHVSLAEVCLAKKLRGTKTYRDCRASPPARPLGISPSVPPPRSKIGTSKMYPSARPC